MNLWLRLLLLALTARARGTLAAPFGVSRLSMRVLPLELDANGHLNNGRAMTLMDLGRADLVLRTGLARAARGRGWAAVLLGAQVLFRRELRPLQRFRLETRIVTWDAAALVMEHRLIAPGPGGAEATAVLALVRGGLYDRRASLRAARGPAGPARPARHPLTRAHPGGGRVPGRRRGAAGRSLSAPWRARRAGPYPARPAPPPETTPMRRPAPAALALAALLPFAALLPLAAPAAAQEPDLVFKKSTVWKFLTPDDKLATYGVDDPGVEGVACHFTASEKGGLKGAVGLAEETSDVSLACQQVGPVKFKEKFEQGALVMRQSRSLFFKKMQIVRGCDAKRNVLVYLAYSDRLIEGSPKNSTSSVPIMPWGAGAEVPRCADWVQGS